VRRTIDRSKLSQGILAELGERHSLTSCPHCWQRFASTTLSGCVGVYYCAGCRLEWTAELLPLGNGLHRIVLSGNWKELGLATAAQPAAAPFEVHRGMGSAKWNVPCLRAVPAAE
jgi:hypothetical protein